MILPFPHDRKISGILAELFDKPVSLDRAEALHTPAVAAILRQDDGQVHGAITGDAALVATFGAALAMSPPRFARDELESGELGPLAREASAEVFNVLSSLYNASGAPHVKLAEVSYQPFEVMEALQPCMDATGRKALLTVRITDYPVGTMNLLLIEQGARASTVAVRERAEPVRTGFDAWR